MGEPDREIRCGVTDQFYGAAGYPTRSAIKRNKR